MAKDSVRSTIIVEETECMERERRLLEQARHNKFAKINAREHRLDDNQPQNANELEMNNGIPQHPFLATQRFDGTDPNLNPEPPLNSQARADYDNAKREQEMEKQLRLGLVPDFKNTPTPKPM